MIPTDPQDDGAIDMADAGAAPVQPDPNLPPDSQPAPKEETPEEWMRRFLDENEHLALPPVARPPAPPPQPWDGPMSQWKVPDHLSMPHPNGGYMAAALMSRMTDDLEEVTGGKRAATYEEVDKYLGHALIAEGLVPFTYTADEAVRWWKAGGYKVLGISAADANQSNATVTKNDSALAEPSENGGTATGMVLGQDAPRVNTQIDVPGPSSVPPRVSAPVLQTQNQGEVAGTEAYRQLIDGNRVQWQPAEQTPGKLLPEADIPLAFPSPRTTFRTDKEWVMASRVKPMDIPRLSGKNIVATPEMKIAAAANVSKLAVDAQGTEILAFGYLMPNGTIEVRVVQGKPGDLSYRGHPSGQGKVLFGIHGHPSGDGSDGMVDAPYKNGGYGDTQALFMLGIPMATVYDGKIGWHEMVKGQLIFTAPREIVTSAQLSALQENLTTSQRLFLTP